MESLTLIRPILIKVIVTEHYKKNAIMELQEAIRQVEVELQRLDYQEKRLVAELEKKNSPGIPAAKQHLEQERQRLTGNRNQLFSRLKEVHALALGAEIIYGKMESPVEIKAGDDWRQVLGVEVVLQDGIVAEIRP